MNLKNFVEILGAGIFVAWLFEGGIIWDVAYSLIGRSEIHPISVFLLFVGIYLFNHFKEDNGKKAWGLLLLVNAIALIITYPMSFLQFFSIIFSMVFLNLFLYFILFLMGKYGYSEYFGGRVISAGGFGGGFSGFGRGRSGGGGFGGKW